VQSTTASTVRYCSKTDNNICLSVGVPSTSASSNSGNIYLQIRAPTTYSWVSFGTGTVMTGASMFVVYQNGAGNVTVSPRYGTGRTTPPVDTASTAAKLTLLAGSGVSTDDGIMTANLVCSNCDSWTGGGKMSLSSSTSNWIGAWKRGSSLATTSVSARIAGHEATAQFQLDLTQATLAADSNPFVSGSTITDTSLSSNPNASSSSVNATTSTANSTNNANSTAATGSGISTASKVVEDEEAEERIERIIAVHGILMAVIFVALYPLGSIIMAVFGKWKYHAIFQIIVFVAMWIGFALGMYVAVYDDLVSGPSYYGAQFPEFLQLQLTGKPKPTSSSGKNTPSSAPLWSCCSSSSPS
jgi:hypothetical protein